MANTLRVSIQPNNGATRVIRIAQPSLRVTISKGVGAALPTEKTFGAAKVYGSLVKGYAANGLPNTDTQAAIDYALAQGCPSWSIIWMYQGEAVAGSVSSKATVPAFSAWSTFTPPSVTATAVGEAVSVSATIPALTALAAFMSPTVAAQQVATGTVVQFSSMAAFVSPTVTAQQFATASVPQYAASATFSAPSVTVTPAGATAATVTVPSFGEVATFAAPSVTAQGAATASIPSFFALASLSAASVTGQRLATAAVSQFTAIASLSAPGVTGVVQTLATVAAPQFTATSTLTPPTVAAARVATASVPSFGATAELTAPTVAGVQQAAAVSATATVPSLTARATLAAPSVAGVIVGGGGPVTLTENFTTGPTSWPGVGDIGCQWSRSGVEVYRDATAKFIVFNLYAGLTPRWAEVAIPSMSAGKLDFDIPSFNTDYGEWSIEVLCNGSRIYYNANGGYDPIHPQNIAYPSGTNTFRFILVNLTLDGDAMTMFIDTVRWVPNS